MITANSTSHGVSRRGLLRGSAALAASAAGSGALRAAPATRTLKLGYAISRDSHFGAGADEFSRQVSAFTNGTWQIEQHPNGFLGGELEMIENVRKGQLDLAIIYTGALSSTMPELGLFDLPFLFRDVTQACAVLDGPIGQSYFAGMRKHDLVGLAWGENGLRHITNSRRPIRAPEDLRGLKFRVPQSEVMLRCFRQLGTDAAPLSFSALYGALESGRFEGQENPIPVIRAAQLDRVQRFLTLSGHCYASALFIMSRDCWDELGDEERKIFTEAARAGGKATRHYVRHSEQTGVEAMRAQGNEVVPQIDGEAFQAALEPTWSELAGRFGAPILDRIRATPMRGRMMRLRSVFLAGCIVLALPGLFAAGYEASRAAEALHAAEAAAGETKLAAEIMQVATKLMVERGRWQDAASQENPHTAVLSQAKETTDAALARVDTVSRIERSPAAFLAQIRESLATVRARGEAAVLRRSSMRATIEQYDRMVEGLDTTIAQLKRDVTLLSPQVGVILGLAETASSLRGIAGRRGVLLNTWFGGQDLTAGQKEELELLTGKLSGAWEMLRRGVSAAALSPEPGKGALAAGETFITTKEPWYRELVRAAMTDAGRPLEYPTFRAWHVKALQGLVPVRDILLTEAMVTSEGLIAAARKRLAVFLGLVTISVSLVAGAVAALLRGLVEPVQSMTKAMTVLAAGDLDGAAPKPSRLEEIASLGIAVEAFRDALKDLHQQETELRQANIRFETVLGSMVQGLCQYDAEDRLEVFNDRFSEIFGIAPGLMRPGLAFADVVRLEHEAGNFSAASIQGLIARRMTWRSETDLNTELLELNGGRVVSVSSSIMSNGGWISTYEDVTEQRRSERKLWHMARHDALTNLPNRVLLRERLVAITPQLRRGAKIAVLCLDLDGFKSVNDTLGHPTGDELLRAVAERLRAATREVDLVARIGGDEFAIIQNDAEQPVSAAALAERLVTAMRVPFELAGQTVEIGTSIGVVLADADAEPDELLRSADIALYQAKAGGRGTWRFFEPGMDAAMQARRVLEMDLKRALKEEQFELFYQPLVVAETRALCGFEALLRWRHPERGMVSPAEFIPLTEETGLIRPIGAWVLKKACEDATAWPDHVKIAVNLSPVQFTKGDLYQDVEHALVASGLPAERLELEITESALLQDNDATLALLHRLRSLGVSISMDDFGTGYSSLSYLRCFPFDKIKIDQSFVRNLKHEKGGIEIVRAVVDLGRGLGMTVLAEGVETEEQFAVLRAEQCDHLQGYLFSKPVPGRDIPPLLTSQAFVFRAPLPGVARDATGGSPPQDSTGAAAA